MGWMSWEIFRCDVDCVAQPDDCISHRLYKQTADALVEQGLAAAGYDMVHIDDCWESMQRDSGGRLVANSTRFPKGIRELADYVHDRGVKLGIYSDMYVWPRCGSRWFCPCHCVVCRCLRCFVLSNRAASVRAAS